MRILQVRTSLYTGGAESLVVNLILRMQAKGHIVDLVVFNGYETPLMEKLRRESPQTKIYKLGSRVYNPLYILKLARIMKGYDIVHTHNSSPQLFTAIARKLCSVKLCSTEHNTSNRKRNWKWYAPIESWMYRQYDHVICISNIAEQRLREYMGRGWLNEESKYYNRISTINNGVDVRTIHEAIGDEKLIKAKKNRTAILMVAGFRLQKDQDTIVEALKVLGTDNFEVWFAGVGVRQEAVKELSEKLGVSENVKFLGMRTDVPQVLNAADVIVMSSHWEGLSLSNIEGMSVNKPFIASDVDGLREVTQNYGILFPHKDAIALAKIIDRLHTDKDYYHTVADRCYKRALEFDVNKMVEGYIDIYRSLI